MLCITRNILYSPASLIAWTAAAAAAVVVALCLLGCDGSRPELSPPLVHADVSQLDHVDILPSLTIAPIQDQQSVMWCATLEIAWSDLVRRNHAPVEFAATKPGENVTNLNASTLTPEGLLLGRDDLTFMSGGVEVLKKLRTHIQQRGNELGRPVLAEAFLKHAEETPPPPNAVIIYADHSTEMAFTPPFERLDGKLRFNGTSVACFGIEAHDHPSRENVTAYRSTSYGKHCTLVIREGEEGSDELLVASFLSRPETLESAVNEALHRLDGTKHQFSAGDQFLIPVVDVDLGKRFSGFENRKMRNGRFRDFTTKFVGQRIRFLVDETSARLRSEAAVRVDSAPMRVFFDGPFLIMLRKNGAKHPYFVMWVATTDVLRRVVP